MGDTNKPATWHQNSTPLETYAEPPMWPFPTTTETVQEQLAEYAAQVRKATIAEVAAFVETHYCVMDPERGYPHYILHAREKHPAEPLACAIRGLANLPHPGTATVQRGRG